MRTESTTVSIRRVHLFSSSPDAKNEKKVSNPSRFSQHPLFRYHIKFLHRAHLALGSASLEQDNVAVLDDVVLALGHDLTLGLDLGLSAQLLEHGIVVHNDLDESLFKVTVDDTGSLRSLGAVTDGPLAHLIGASGEEGAKVEGLAHGRNDLGKS